MLRTLRPWTTAGVALVGASMIAVTPVAGPLPGAQLRAFQLTSYDEFNLAQLVSATETNWAGLQSALGTSNWLTNPDISQGFTTLFTDLAHGTANPVTNPVSLLTEAGLLFTSSGDPFNAASTAATAVTDNIEAALSSHDYATALTDLENAPTTILYGFLNGYPQTVGSELLSPQLGLLTNTTDGASTGGIDAWQQVSNTVADEVANVGGANLPTGTLPLVTGNLDLSVNLNQILSDLGLTSGGGPLTINGLLADLNIPSSFSIGQILSLLHLSDSSGFTVGQILQDLNLTDTSTLTPPSISVGDVLNALGLSDSKTITPPSIEWSTILQALGLENAQGQITNSLSFSVPGISWSTILQDLGIENASGQITGSLNFGVPNVSFTLDQILGILGINPNQGIGFNAGCVFNHCLSVSVTLNDILNALIHNTNPGGSLSVPDISIPYSTILNDLHIPTSGTLNVPDLTIPVATILHDLGIDPTGSITVPPISVGDILTALHLTDGSTFTPPSISVGDVLTALHLTDNSQAINIGDVLNFLHLNDNSSISFDSILNAIGINPNEDIFQLLGISNTLSPTLDLTGGSVQAFDLALSQDLLALLGNFSTLAQDLPSLLTNNPTLDLVPLLSNLLTDLGLPATITGGDLTAELTNIGAELIHGLVP
jgi:hypothetical protein